MECDEENRRDQLILCPQRLARQLDLIRIHPMVPSPHRTSQCSMRDVADLGGSAPKDSCVNLRLRKNDSFE